LLFKGKGEIVMRFLFGLILFAAIVTHAEIRTAYVEYSDGETVLEGFIAWDDSKSGKVPGILIVHEWNGLNEHSLPRAEKLAEEGYFAFAADIYGKGIRPKTMQESAAQAGKYKSDRQLLRSRVIAGLNKMKEFSQVDQAKIAAIGYCFGGTTVLELARSGAEISGVVSFHGNLDNPKTEDAGNIKTKVLVCHGAADPFVPAEEVNAFTEEMNREKIDWIMISYGNAVHSFTNPGAGNDPSRGAAYNASADERSWEDMKLFFSRIFK